MYVRLDFIKIVMETVNLVVQDVLGVHRQANAIFVSYQVQTIIMELVDVLLEHSSLLQAIMLDFVDNVYQIVRVVIILLHVIIVVEVLFYQLIIHVFVLKEIL